MVVIYPDKTKKNVILTQDEIGMLLEELGRVPNDIYTFMNYDKIVDKLKKAKKMEVKNGK